MNFSVKIAGIFAVAAFALTAVSANAAFTRDLTLGSTGADVIELQTWLEAKGFLTIPAGTSKGYFGALTQSALAKYQASAGIAPAAGYFGPVTRAKVATEGGVTTPTPGTGTLNGGDGDFKDFDLLGDPSSEDLEEGDDSAVIGFEFEADDSDLAIERVDFMVTDGETKPWRTFESFSLYHGDDKVADIDASDSDEWDEGDDDVYEATFSDIDAIVKEGDMAEFYIYAEVKDSIDSDDLPQDWTITIPEDGIRALNAEGVSVYAPNNDESEDFTVEEVAEGELDIKVDEDDNKDRVVEVDEDNATDDVVLYVGTIEGDEGDNTIDEFSFDLLSDDADIKDIVKTFRLIIDGDEVASETSSKASTTDETITFDDVDFEVGEDDEVEFEIVADVRATDDGDNFVSGETLQVTGLSVDFVDGQDDDVTITESTEGGIITLSDNSVMVELSSVATPSYVGNDESKGKFTIKFTVTAPEDDDVYIPLNSATDSFAVIDAETGATTTATTTSATFTGGKISSGHIKISEGQEATVTLTVNLDNAGGADRSLRVGLREVTYKLGSTGASASYFTSGLDEDFETDDLLLYGANITD